MTSSSFRNASRPESTSAAACDSSHVSDLLLLLPSQAFFLSATFASVHAACSNAATLDTSASHFAAVSRIATDDAAYGASDVEVAGDFSVHYDTYFKVVNTHCGTHQPYKCAPKTYVLRLCGGAEPTAFSNGTALPTDATHFTIPVTGVALPGSVPVTFLEMLGLRDKIKLVNPENVHSPCLQHLEQTEQIDTQTSDYGTADWGDRAAAHSEVEVVFTDSWSNGTPSATAKDVIFDASSDPGALARAEWIKFISLFFNLEERANLYFTREQTAFASISTATAAVAAATTPKTCAWVQLSFGNYEISYATYKQELCVGAGLVPWTDADDLALAKPKYKKKFNATTSVAAFHAVLATIDVVIDETYHPAPTNATKAVVLAELGIADPTATTASLKTTALFLRTDGHVSDAVTKLTDSNANALDWYESAVARPALVLADLAHKVWPAAITAPADGCAQYFRDVLIGEMPTVNSNEMCDTWSAAENEQKCLNNPVLVTDTYLAANKSPGAMLAVTAASFIAAAFLLA